MPCERGRVQGGAYCFGGNLARQWLQPIRGCGLNKIAAEYDNVSIKTVDFTTPANITTILNTLGEQEYDLVFTLEYNFETLILNYLEVIQLQNAIQIQHTLYLTNLPIPTMQEKNS